MTTSSPLVTLIVACRNVQKFIGATLDSASGQSLKNIEIIVIDDGSTDDTVNIVQQHMKADDRIHLYRGKGVGPAAARNIGIQKAKGDWIAVLDGDDLIHEDRLTALLAIAIEHNADLVADELIAFVETSEARNAWPFFGSDLPAGDLIELADLYRRPRRFLAESPLGYLKILVKAKRLKDLVNGYDERLIIGEDFDLLARLLATGARMALSHMPYYFYRRHSQSMSHRMNDDQAGLMLAAGERFQEKFGPSMNVQTLALFTGRQNRLAVYADSLRIISKLKGTAKHSAMHLAVTRPRALLLTFGFLLQGQLRRLSNFFSGKKTRRIQAYSGLSLLIQSNGADIGPLANRRNDTPQAVAVVNLPSDHQKCQDGARVASAIFSSSYRVLSVTGPSVDARLWHGFVMQGATSIN